MPRIPSISPATGNPTSSSFIHTTDCNFVDSAGRTLLLRGVNLSDVSKAPVDRPSYILDDFWDSAENGGRSFTGRPLNIDDGSADVHLARLRGWGFNMLRFPFTWEALEHEGPGIYDEEFIDYTLKVLHKCKEYGFKIFMDPHQDVWSRFSGGSGAPLWTLAACGLNPRNFTATQCAIVHCEYPLAHNPDPSSLPAMIWSTNYGRLVSQTVFTLFFAGRDFAPRCVIDGKNIQDYLQDHYLAAVGHLADRIRDEGGLLDECIIGWDSMNEPFEGLCGWLDLNHNPVKQGSTLRKGSAPTPAQSLRLGMGQTQTVDNISWGMFGPRKDGTVTIDPAGRTIWADKDLLGEDETGYNKKWGWTRGMEWTVGTCIWALHGVWDIETGYVLLPDYFYRLPIDTPESSNSSSSTPQIVEVEFIEDYWRPHWQTYAQRIRSAHPEAIIFIQPPVFGIPPSIEEEHVKGRCAYSGHYYDGLTLVTRHWNWFNADALGLLRGKYKSSLAAVKIGESAIRNSLQEQLALLKSDISVVGSYPTLIGEIGTPFDMDGKRSYGWTDNGKHAGDYSNQEKALDASLNAADGGNCLNYTIWTYSPDSTHIWGDGWNMEDLSLWSADDMNAPTSAELSGLGIEEGSRAVLLGRSASGVLGGSSPPRGATAYQSQSAEASQMSLATLDVAARQDPRVGRERAGWHENPYLFLTNGSRAVRAYARPFPEKVVGKSVDIKFDAHKSEFRLSVLVRAEDRPVQREDDGSPPSSKGDIATEIFIPLVHYAHPRLFSLGVAQKGHNTNTTDSNTPNGFSSTPSSSRSSTPTPPELADSVSSGSQTFCSSAPSSNLQYTIAGQEHMVDVDVTVTAGHWAIQNGQTLKWWYDVPPEGERDREYTIIVKRKGGAISARGVDTASWSETLCPEDGNCVVM